MAAHSAQNVRRHKLTRRLGLVIVIVTALLAAGTATAFAYWRSTGSGTGSGTTGTMTINVTALQSGDTTGETTLIPGGTGDVLLRVNNPNGYSVQVSAISANGSISASNSCSTSGVTFTSPASYAAAQFTLAPGSNLLRLSSALAMNLSVSSACQGATFTIPVSVTVQR